MLQSQLTMLADLGGRQSQLGAFFMAAVTDLAGVGVGMSAEHLMTGGSTSTVQTVGAAVHLAFNVARGVYETGSGIAEGGTLGGNAGLISSGTDAIYSGATLYGSIALANAAKRYTPYGQAYDIARGLLSGGIAAWAAANHNGEVDRLQAGAMHSFNRMNEALADMETGLELARERCK
jgi:N-acetylmuramic acid 6-phosphate (MurNAc-6-P) etherase